MPLEEETPFDDGMPTEPENSITESAPEGQTEQVESSAGPDPDLIDGPDAVDESPALSEVLVREAKDIYGLTDDDMASFGTDDDLSRQLGAIDRLSMQRFGQNQAAQAAAQTPNQEQEPPETSADSGKWTPEKMELDISDEFEPEVLELLNKINDHNHNQILKQQEQNDGRLQGSDEFLNGVRQQQAIAYEEQLDGYFDNLSEDHKAIFGTGRMVDLPANGIQRQNRLQWEQDYQSQMQIDDQAGRQLSTFDEYKDRVLRARWGNQVDQATRRDVRAQAATQRRKAIHRPTSRQTKSATPIERAGDFADQFYRERGESVYADQTTGNQDV